MPAHSPMDDEPVIAAAQSAQAAAAEILNLIGQSQADAGETLHLAVSHLAEATHALISFMPQRDETDDQLLCAVAKWL